MTYDGESITKETLIEDIQKLQPQLSIKELQEESEEDLTQLLEELQERKKQREEKNFRELDPELKDVEDPYHHHDPNPDRFPTYEKPRPVPDPPLENE